MIMTITTVTTIIVISRLWMSWSISCKYAFIYRFKLTEHINVVKQFYPPTQQNLLTLLNLMSATHNRMHAMKIEHININSRKLITSDLRFWQQWLKGTTLFLDVMVCTPVEICLWGTWSGEMFPDRSLQFHVYTAVTVRIAVLWDVTSLSPQKFIPGPTDSLLITPSSTVFLEKLIFSYFFKDFQIWYEISILCPQESSH
jgi:hypothetical protein